METRNAAVTKLGEGSNAIPEAVEQAGRQALQRRLLVTLLVLLFLLPPKHTGYNPQPL